MWLACRVSGLVLGGMFYGVASTWLAHGRMVDLVLKFNPRASRILADHTIIFAPGWALYISFGIVGIAYVLMFWLTAGAACPTTYVTAGRNGIELTWRGGQQFFS